MNIFKKNHQKIIRHNTLHATGLVSYKLAINKFADRHPHEISTGFRGTRDTHDLHESKFSRGDEIEVPDEVDWRLKGAVTAVKQQGDCGACWAFSVVRQKHNYCSPKVMRINFQTGTLEGQYFRKTGRLVSLSEQNLIDCSDYQYSNFGCEGGFMNTTYLYIKDNGGIDLEDYYPYEGIEDDCRYSKAKQSIHLRVKGYVSLPKGDEEALRRAVATVGPISVAIDGTDESLLYYDSGLYDNPSCSSEKLTHALLLVGYGTENGKDYWLLKNSWGDKWGEGGYLKMVRNKENQCGVATWATYPKI